MCNKFDLLRATVFLFVIKKAIIIKDILDKKPSTTSIVRAITSTP